MEITLQNPMALLLLLTIPLLILLHYYFFEHNKRRAMKFANFTAMKRVTGTHLITKNTSQLVIRIFCILFLALGIAKPVIWYEGDASITDYVIAIDSSASMVSSDVLPNRLTVAKNAASSFLDSLKADTQIGLISFSGVSFIKYPVTRDLKKIKDEISTIQIELSGGTDIGGAIITAANMLTPQDKSKSVILITDGSDTAGSFVDESIDTALEYAQNNHIIVNTIGIGTGIGKAGYLEESGLKAVYDTDTIKKIAEATGGKYFEVKNTAEIATAFKNIASETQKAKIPYDATAIMLTLGIALLFVEWGLLNTRFRALP